MAGSVSSHLTPEPERRLWLILEDTRRVGALADVKIAALIALSAAELAAMRPLGLGALVALWAALPLGLFAFSSLERLPGLLSFLDPSGKPHVDDNLVSVEDLAKYSHGELVHRFDKYLGGGITATQYHEDIVGQIVAAARVAARKRRLLRLLLVLAAAGQFNLFAWR